MNFERGQDPKEAIKIGQKENPITIIAATYPVQAGYSLNWMEVGPSILINFLSFLERTKKIGEVEKSYSISESMVFDIIDEISMQRKEVGINYLRGRIVRIEYLDGTLYKIPMDK
jgi:hypothetical protein